MSTTTWSCVNCGHQISQLELRHIIGDRSYCGSCVWSQGLWPQVTALGVPATRNHHQETGATS